jgi:hypothetical protein
MRSKKWHPYIFTIEMERVLAALEHVPRTRAVRVQNAFHWSLGKLTKNIIFHVFLNLKTNWKFINSFSVTSMHRQIKLAFDKV